MPQLMSFLPMVAGGVLSGIGGAGKQGGQNTLSQATHSSQQQILPVEADYFAGGREALLPYLFQQLARAQAPIYGDAQKAKVLEDLNSLALDSITKLRGQLGDRGRSGFAEAKAAEIEQNRLGELAQFFRQLPQLERQAQLAQVQSVLNPAMGWFGAAPVGQQSSSTVASTQQSQSTLEGPNAWRNILDNLGGILGRGDFRPPAPNTSVQQMGSMIPLRTFGSPSQVRLPF